MWFARAAVALVVLGTLGVTGSRAAFPGETDSTTIVYTNDFAGTPNLYVEQADGTGQRALDAGAFSDYNPQVSADGKRVVFVSDRAGTYDLYTMPIDGSAAPTRVLALNGREFNPSFSPDGKTIVFANDGGTGAIAGHDLYSVGVDGTNLTRLTNNSVWDDEPAWSPDGTKIAFSSGRSGSDKIWTMKPDGSSPVNLTAGLSGGTYRAEWSPDGKEIAFDQADVTPGLWKMSANGTGFVRLTSVFDMHASWSPDGSAILFDSTARNTAGAAQLFRIAAGGGAVTAVATSSGNSRDPAWQPHVIAPANTALPTVTGTPRVGYLLTASTGSWSGTQPLTYSYRWLHCTPVPNNPNACYPALIAGATSSTYRVQSSDVGSGVYVQVIAANAAGSASQTSYETPLIPPGKTNGQLYYERNDGGTDPNIYAATPLGQERPVVVASSSADFGPTVSPDGQKLAFASNRDGNNEIYVADASGGGIVRLTTNAASDVQPKWTADGTQIVFTSDRTKPGDNDVWIMNADGTNQHALVTAAGNDHGGSLSPDGSTLVWQSNRSGTSQIWTMDAKGTLRNLSNNAASEADPAWSPDGTRIAFDSNRGPSAQLTDVWTMDATGANAVDVTHASGSEDQPAWSPDGTQLAYWTNGYGGDSIATVANDPAATPTRVAGGSQPAWAPKMHFDSHSTQYAPKLDGVFDPAEWAGATQMPVRMGASTGTAYYMNDGKNLYSALVLNDPTTGTLSSASFDFDNDDSGVDKVGNDELVVNATGVNSAYDDFRNGVFTPGDTESGGTNDVAGGGVRTAPTTVFEVSHPLCSGDAGHDFCVKAGDTIGINVTAQSADGSTYKGYPSPSFLQPAGFAELTIAPWSDTTPPKVTVTSPKAGALVGPTTTVTADATDNAAVTAVDFYADGVFIGRDTDAPYTARWQNANADGSASAITAIATDTAGLAATSAPVSVTLDAAGPVTTLTAPADGSDLVGSVTVSADASDAAGVDRVVFQLHSPGDVTDGFTNIGAQTRPPYSIAWDTRTYADGYYSLRALAFDSFGNQSRSTTVSVQLLNQRGIAKLVTTQPLDAIDPALGYTLRAWQLERATCEPLMSYPDAGAPRGAHLVPDAAAAPPTVSPDGTVYQFTVREGLRFSNGEALTAASYKYAIERALAPSMAGPAKQFLDDVVGAKEYAAGSTESIGGIAVSGSQIKFTLVAPRGDFLARLSMPFFCPVPLTTPKTPQVDAMPGAGPYWVASHTTTGSPGTVTTVLTRNPYYAGDRPQNFHEIDYYESVPYSTALDGVRSGTYDYLVDGVHPVDAAGMNGAYGAGAETQRLFVNPTLSLRYLSLNTRTGAMANALLRRAVNYALDRPAIVSAVGEGQPTDQVIPPGLDGFSDADLYPLAGPDVAKARSLLRDADSTNHITLLTSCSPCSPTPTPNPAASVIAQNLHDAGFTVVVVAVPRSTQIADERNPDFTWDVSTDAWLGDYPDPADYLNAFLDSANIPPNGLETNTAYFSDPTWDARLRAAAALDGDARSAAYAKLDADVMSDPAPIAPIATVSDSRDFFSQRMACQLYTPSTGIDLAALCDRNDLPVPKAVSTTLTSSGPASATGEVSTKDLSLSAFSQQAGGHVATPVEDMPVEDMPVEDMPVEDMPVEDMPVEDMPISRLGLDDPSVRAALANVPLSQIGVDGGWAAVLDGTSLAGIPEQQVTLGDVFGLSPLPPALDPASGKPQLKLGALQLAGSNLHLTFGALMLGKVHVSQLQGLPSKALSAIDAWCTGTVDPGGVPCDPATVGDRSLVALSIEGAPVEDMPVEDMPVEDMPVEDMPVEDMPVEDMPTSASPVEDMPVEDMPTGAPFLTLPADKLIAHSPQIAALLIANLVPGSLAVDCLGHLALCTATATLGDALAAGAVPPTATLRDLLPAAGMIPLGQLGFYGEPSLTFKDLIHSLPNPSGFTIRDAMAVFVPRNALRWETLQPPTLVSYASDRPALSLQAGFTLAGVGVNAAHVTVTLPARAAYVAGSAKLFREGVADGAVGEPSIEYLAHDVQQLTWNVGGAVFGDRYSIHFDATPGIDIGESGASATVASGGVSGDGTGAVSVTDTFEPNGLPSEAPLAPANSSVLLSYISNKDDRDYYKIHLPETVGSRVIVTLTNLPADFDVALLSPAASTIRPTSQTGFPLQDPPIRDTGADLSQPAATLEPSALQDVPGTEGFSVLQLSSNRATRAGDQVDEDVSAVVTSANAGQDLYVEVFGYNGASSREPYTMRVRTKAPVNVSCDPRPGSGGVRGTMPNTSAWPADLNTLFLVDQKRLGDDETALGAPDGAKNAADAVKALTDLAKRRDLGISGAVLPVDAYDDVQSLYDGWSAKPCDNSLANGVAAAIASKVDAIRAQFPKLKYVVLAGDDDQIPHFRVADLTTIANESKYAHTFSNNEYFGALADSNVLSDSPYGDVDPVDAGSHQVFLEDLVLGRLPETAALIQQAAAQYQSAGGKLDAKTAVVAGYKMTTDSSQAIAGELGGILGAGKVDSSLIGDSWQASDLTPLAFPGAAGAGHGILDVNAHFSHNLLKPADGSALVPSSAVRGVTGSIVFTVGCHAGLAVADAVVGAGSTAAPDWAQAFASNGAVFVGNLGYGYADSDYNLLSENLITRLAGKLDGSLPIGEALQRAKRDYYLSRTAFSAYDEKVLDETTFYGLPMYGVGVAPPNLDHPAGGTPAAPPSTVVGAPGATQPSTSSLETDAQSGLTGAPFSADPVFTEQTGPNGTFLTNGGQAQAPNYRPLEPYVSLDAARDGLVAHGVVIDGLASGDTNPFDPVFVYPRPQSDPDRPVEPQFEQVAYPSKIPTLVSAASLHGVDQSLNLATGQFYTDDTGAGVQRRFQHVSGHVLYALPSVHDFTAPAITQSTSYKAPGSATFEVAASDVDESGNAGVVKLVQVDYRIDHDTDWHVLRLTRGDSGAWTGGAPFTGQRLEFFTIACDAAANCAYSSNKGTYYEAQPLPAQPPSGPITIHPSGPSGQNGWITGDATVSVDAPAGVGVEYSVDGGAFRPYGNAFTITTDGAHVVTVRATDGTTVQQSVLVDATPPAIALTTPVEGETYKLNEHVPADFTCADVGSGASACSGTAGNGAAIDTSHSGNHTFTVTATDFAGNTSSVTHVYGVNRPPTQPGVPTASENPSDGSFTLTWSPSIDPEGNPVTYTLLHKQASDADFSVVAGGLTTASKSFAEGDEPQGAWTYLVRASDGDVSTDSLASAPVVVDLTNPTIDVSCPAGKLDLGQAADATFSAADAGGSGLATPSAGTIHLDTSTSGPHTVRQTARDGAGRATVGSCAYVVNSPPTAPGRPSASAPVNDGRFVVTWAASSDADGDPIAYTLLHKDADDAGYSVVAAGLSGTSYTFSQLHLEGEGTWTYVVRATDAKLVSPDSAASAGVVADESNPVDPTLTTNRVPDFGSWFKDSVTVKTSSNGDHTLFDGSPGSGVASTSPDQTVTANGVTTVTGAATDAVGHSAYGTLAVSVDSLAPKVTVTCPSAPVQLGAAASAPWTATDSGSGVAAPASGTLALDTKAVGPHTASASATDNVGHVGTGTCSYAVIYRFSGFFSPVNNLPTVNVVKAGSAVPVKFGLSGNQGLAIFAAGYPRSVAVACDTGAPTDAIEQTLTAGSSSLSYDAGADQYTYVWKTPSTWAAGSCHMLEVVLVDGTVHRASFKAK